MAEMDRRKFLAVSALSALGIVLTGCSGYSDDMTMDEILELLRRHLDGEIEEDAEDLGPVNLALTYPAGRSPKVFTSGWVFGAKCTAGDKDFSTNVKWSGTGSFNPQMGSICRPVFNGAGTNEIKLSVNVGGTDYEKTFTVDAVSPSLYAAVGDKAQCDADSHGCPACPHPVIGPIISGSPNVLINGKPAARVGDRGVHSACCGPNTYEIAEGDSQVLINGRPAAKKGHRTNHCGGVGRIVTGAA